MDTNGDGIIDDPLATKKGPGRKSLGLSPEEMKERRSLQRKLREYNKRFKKRQEDINLLVATIITLANETTGDDIANRLVHDKKWVIDYNPNATVISGVSGERIRRPKK